MTGFIYIWFDKRYKRFYLGSHWGTETDGYVCSSKAMREARRRRPENFKRRIVARVTTNRHDLLTEEQRWLDMIKPEEFGRRYYNINAKVNKLMWWMNDETIKIVGTKLSRAQKGISKRHSGSFKSGSAHRSVSFGGPNKGKKFSEEHRQNISDGRKGIPAWNKGQPRTWKSSTEFKPGMEHKLFGFPSPYVGIPRAEEIKQQISTTMKTRGIKPVAAAYSAPNAGRFQKGHKRNTRVAMSFEERQRRHNEANRKYKARKREERIIQTHTMPLDH